MVVNIQEAKTQLSSLLARVATGEETVIARAGEPIARLAPLVDRPKPRVLGQDEGLFEVPEDFNDPLPADVLADFVSSPPSESPAAGETLADFLRGHIGVLHSSEHVPGGARMSESCGEKLAAGLVKKRSPRRRRSS
jgi:prevent-host-death family protein